MIPEEQREVLKAVFDIFHENQNDALVLLASMLVIFFEESVESNCGDKNKKIQITSKCGRTITIEEQK